MTEAQAKAYAAELYEQITATYEVEDEEFILEEVPVGLSGQYGIAIWHGLDPYEKLSTDELCPDLVLIDRVDLTDLAKTFDLKVQEPDPELEEVI